MQNNKSYIDIKFYKIWRVISISRPQKEFVKNILFSNASILFNRFLSYQNWKHAQLFKPSNSNDRLEYASHCKSPEKLKLAIVIHVFYLDVLKDILAYIDIQEPTISKLFVTTTKSLEREIKLILGECGLKYEVMVVANHGRDILPFLTILPSIFKQGYNLILKLHTKKSNHLNKKDIWSNVLFDNLISKGSIKSIKSLFESHPEIGILGPEGNILSMHLNYGSNPETVKDLCLKIGLSIEELRDFNFVAGSMFYARKEVLQPILDLNLSLNDFEPENSQLDGTLAHAIERVFSAGLKSKGLLLVDSTSKIDNLKCRITKDHPFTI